MTDRTLPSAAALFDRGMSDLEVADALGISFRSIDLLRRDWEKRRPMGPLNLPRSLQRADERGDV